MRFNVSRSLYRGRFEGLPSPAAAGMVATTQWFVSFVRQQGITVQVPELLVAIGVASLGLLMVSAIPYRSFKEVDLRHAYRTVVLVIVVLALLILEPAVSLFVVGLLYVLAGPIEWLWRLAVHRPLEKLPEPLVSEPQRETPT